MALALPASGQSVSILAPAGTYQVYAPTPVVIEQGDGWVKFSWKSVPPIPPVPPPNPPVPPPNPPVPPPAPRPPWLPPNPPSPPNPTPVGTKERPPSATIGPEPESLWLWVPGKPSSLIRITENQ